jgi:hypothetical protein
MTSTLLIDRLATNNIYADIEKALKVAADLQVHLPGTVRTAEQLIISHVDRQGRQLEESIKRNQDLAASASVKQLEKIDDLVKREFTN